MDAEYEIRTLAAETLALQTILAQVLQRVALVSPDLGAAVSQGFDEAANIVEHTAIIMGKAGRPEHTTRAIQVVEELRAAALGSHSEPKHGV